MCARNKEAKDLDSLSSKRETYLNDILTVWHVYNRVSVHCTFFHKRHARLGPPQLNFIWSRVQQIMLHLFLNKEVLLLLLELLL